MTYGEKIKKARKEAGLTQAELANKCGLAAITIQQYERNLREPKIEALRKIAEALGMPSPAYFVFDPIPDETEKSPAPDEGEADRIMEFMRSLPKDRLRGILVALGAPEEVLAELDQK